MLEYLIEHLVVQVPSKTIYSQANAFYKVLPVQDKEFIELCDSLLNVSADYMKFISIWIKKRNLYDLRFFETYEKWLEKYITDWAICDQFCYRILNPIVENNFRKVKTSVKKWCHSDKIFINRASIVCLIHSGNDFEINLPLEFVWNIIDEVNLKENKYIRNAIGWVLKYAYLKDKDSTIEYITENNFCTAILNKAKEKMSDNDKIKVNELRKRQVY